MLRFLNIVAILSLMGSAVYAYTIKYETAYRAEQIAKTKIEIKQERDAIAVLRAEWAFMTRPERLQQLVEAHLHDMKQLDVSQIVTARQLPDKAPHVDTIGQKLDALMDFTATPDKEPETTGGIPKAAEPKAVTPAKAPANATPANGTSANGTPANGASAKAAPVKKTSATPAPAKPTPAKTTTTLTAPAKTTTPAPKASTTAKAQPIGPRKL